MMDCDVGTMEEHPGTITMCVSFFSAPRLRQKRHQDTHRIPGYPVCEKTWAANWAMWAMRAGNATTFQWSGPWETPQVKHGETP